MSPALCGPCTRLRYSGGSAPYGDEILELRFIIIHSEFLLTSTVRDEPLTKKTTRLFEVG